MAKNTDAASIASLIGAAVESDPEVAARVRRLISLQLDQAEYIMQWGSPADKAMLFRASVPAMMKALQRTEEDEETKAQRAAIERIYKGMRGGKT